MIKYSNSMNFSYGLGCRTSTKREMSNVLDVECYLPAHLPKRNKYHLHEAEDLEIINGENIHQTFWI